MESKDGLKVIYLKNHTCYYFDDIMEINYVCSEDTLLDEKLYIKLWEYFNLWHFIQSFYGFKTIAY